MRWSLLVCLLASACGGNVAPGVGDASVADSESEASIAEAATDSALLDAGCPPGSTPSWTKPGCDLPPDSCFDPMDACTAETTVCGCDGKPVIAPCNAAPVPWKASSCEAPPPKMCPEIMTSCTLHERLFPYDVAGKCTHCPVEAVCTPMGCAASPACWVKVSTGEMHYTLNDCGAEITAAGFRRCTDEETKLLPMSTTWPPPPMCP